MRFAFLLAIVGCYSPGYRDCEVTCGGGACPSGFVCDQGVCRVEGFSGACAVRFDAGIDSNPNADDDGDGILNKNDNCPGVKNAGQENEDRDARGDACDPCPVDGAAGADNDTDMDGVGDGCDPEPDQRDRIVVFEGFNQGIVLSTGTFSGNWTVSSGQARSTNSGTAISSITWADPDTDVLLVSAQFTITSFEPTTAQQFIGVAQHITGTEAVRCSLDPTSPTGLELVANNQRLTTVPTTVAAGDQAVTYMKRTSTVTECSEAIKDLHTSANLPRTTGTAQAGLFAIGANAVVDWIIIVSRAP